MQNTSRLLTSWLKPLKLIIKQGKGFLTMKMKAITMGCGACLLALSSASYAEVEGNIGITSNYVWRGASQTDDSPAVSGGFDWSSESGFYLGTWASNVDFGPGAGEVELDLYGGYGGSISEAISYDVGLTYYAYPDSDDADFAELGISGSFGPLTAGLAYTISSDVNGPGAFQEGDLYYYLSGGIDLSEGFSLGGTVGFYTFDDDGVAGVGDLDYTHYQIDLTKSAGELGDFTFSLSKADKEANGGDDDMKVFVSLAKSF